MIAAVCIPHVVCTQVNVSYAADTNKTTPKAVIGPQAEVHVHVHVQYIQYM